MCGCLSSASLIMWRRHFTIGLVLVAVVVVISKSVWQRHPSPCPKLISCDCKPYRVVCGAEDVLFPVDHREVFQSGVLTRAAGFDWSCSSHIRSSNKLKLSEVWLLYNRCFDNVGYTRRRCHSQGSSWCSFPIWPVELSQQGKRLYKHTLFWKSAVDEILHPM